MFRENSIEVTTTMIKRIPFMSSGENGKDTNGIIIFDIKFALLFTNEYNDNLFQVSGKN